MTLNFLNLVRFLCPVGVILLVCACVCACMCAHIHKKIVDRPFHCDLIPSLMILCIS